MYMQIHFQNIFLFIFLGNLLNTWTTFRSILFPYSLLNILSGYKHFTFGLITLGNVINQCIILKIIILLEAVKLVKLHRINTQLNRYRTFETEAFVVFKCNILYTNLLYLIYL